MDKAIIKKERDQSVTLGPVSTFFDKHLFIAFHQEF
jgi:hypothetical protein